MLNIENLPSPNFWNYNAGRNLIVLHGTSSGAASAIGWLRNPAAAASANYLVRLDGSVVSLVDPYLGRSAWGNGIANRPDMSNPYIAQAINAGINLNTKSISIEHEAATIDMIRHNAMPAAQQLASMSLVLQLARDFNIPVLRSRIIGHYQIDAVNRPNCPGVINLDQYVTALQKMQDNSGQPGSQPGQPAKLEETISGHTVRGEILLYHRRLFNPLLILGNPLTEEFVDGDGRTCQVFERAVLRFFPEYIGTDWVIQALRLGAEAQDPYPVYTGRDSKITGEIDKFVGRLFNSLVVVGKPLSDVYMDSDNRPTQRYERAILKVYSEFANSDWIVMGQRLGAAYLEAGPPVAQVQAQAQAA